MDPNSADRMALRAALEKLSASASAMAEASNEIKDVVARLETPLVDAAPHPTPSPTPAEVQDSAPPLLIGSDIVDIPRRVAHLSIAPGDEGWPLGVDKRRLAPHYPRPTRPAKPAKPPLSSEEKIMRGVAIGGGIITVAGVILLVSVAIQRGWLGPLGRVIGAYLLALALLAAASYVRKRGTRVEAIVALTTTSHLAAIATTSAVVFILDWWPPLIGSAVILAINIGFLLIGRVWADGKHPVFISALLVSGLCALMFPFAYDAWLPIFSIVAALVVSYRVSSDITRSIAALFGVLIQFTLLMTWPEQPWPAALTGVTTTLLLVGLTLWDPPQADGESQKDIAVEEYWRSFETNTVTTWVSTVAPIIIAIITTFIFANIDWPWLALIAPIGMAAMGVAAHFGNSTTQNAHLETTRIAHLVAVAGLALIAGTFVQVFYSELPTKPIYVMVFLIAGAALFMWMRTLVNGHDMGVVPWVAWLIASVAMTGVLLRNVVALSPLWLTDIEALIPAVLILVFIYTTIAARRVFYGRALWLQLAVGLVLLTQSAISIVTITTFLGNLIAGNVGMMLGFLIGHAAVSILWMVIAAALMLNRKLLDSPGALWTGVGLAVAGTIKLVFFDLVALSGVPRAIAFLLSGIALLTIASMRGRKTAEIKAGAGGVGSSAGAFAPASATASAATSAPAGVASKEQQAPTDPSIS
ncbi:hypothetical protein CDES_06680 [Corynebacterium deserti GIMN1.010]|uniref:DUF2339 domain-containing protein n=1 Tax=Corynebacterium deserti GIMN1.010 TaxID=931089 RepID=A0A0M3Q9K4_9CORY|nr:DUF2339 domain-containing protein [Corynebacterium deserti]ALC05753.1 hypothetical protein CDES_06680 [Corynebacterium deserti GIMN1.010]